MYKVCSSVFVLATLFSGVSDVSSMDRPTKHPTNSGHEMIRRAQAISASEHINIRITRHFTTAEASEHVREDKDDNPEQKSTSIIPSAQPLVSSMRKSIGDIVVDHESLLKGISLITDAQTRLDNAKRFIDEGEYKDAIRTLGTAFTKHGELRSSTYGSSKQSEYLVRFYFSLACYLAHYTDNLQSTILDKIIADSSTDPWINQLRCLSRLLNGFHKARTYSVGYEVQRHTTKSEAEERIQAWIADPTNAAHLREAIGELKPFITDLAPASARTDGRELVGYYLKLLNTTDVSSLNKFTAIVPCGGSRDPANICRRIDAHARYYIALSFDCLALTKEFTLSDIGLMASLLVPFKDRHSLYSSLLSKDRMDNMLQMATSLEEKMKKF